MQSNNVIPIFDFRVYIHVEIPRIGVMIHTKSFIRWFWKWNFPGVKSRVLHPWLRLRLGLR